MDTTPSETRRGLTDRDAVLRQAQADFVHRQKLLLMFLKQRENAVFLFRMVLQSIVTSIAGLSGEIPAGRQGRI